MAMSFGIVGAVVTSVCNVIIRGCSAMENIVGAADNLSSVLELETKLTKNEAFLENEEKRLLGEQKLKELQASFNKPAQP